MVHKWPERLQKQIILQLQKCICWLTDRLDRFCTDYDWTWKEMLFRLWIWLLPMQVPFMNQTKRLSNKKHFFGSVSMESDRLTSYFVAYQVSILPVTSTCENIRKSLPSGWFCCRSFWMVLCVENSLHSTCVCCTGIDVFHPQIFGEESFREVQMGMWRGRG